MLPLSRVYRVGAVSVPCQYSADIFIHVSMGTFPHIFSPDTSPKPPLVVAIAKDYRLRRRWSCQGHGLGGGR